MQKEHATAKVLIGAVCFIVALVFVYRSFYAMRIPEEDTAGTDGHLILPHEVHRAEVAVGRK